MNTRRLAAARRAIAREKAKAGMFADQYVTETPEERVARFDASRQRWSADFDAHKRESWQTAGALIKALPHRHALALCLEYKSVTLPKSPEYLLDAITTYKRTHHM